MNDKDIARMVAMRRAGKSYGDISAAFGKKYPAWSRWYIRRAAPELNETSARVHATGIRSVPLHEQGRDMVIEYKHGDGRVYGCGKVVATYHMFSDREQAAAKVEMLKHKLTCTKNKGEK